MNPAFFSRAAKVAFAALMLSPLMGCVTGGDGGDTAGQTFEVVAEYTPFYRLGPNQPAGPDLSLRRGRLVTMLKRGFGYSQVELDDGVKGFVSTEDLSRTAHPGGGFDAMDGSDFSAPSANPDLQSAAIVERYVVGEGGANIPVEPLPEVPASGFADDPAPATELAEPTALPDFRY